MSKNGVLILHPAKFEIRRFHKFVKVCAKHVQNVLYIDLNFNNVLTDSGTTQHKTFSRTEMYNVLEKIYKSNAQELNSLDVRVLLENEPSLPQQKRSFSKSLDVAFLDSTYKSEPSIVERACMRYNFESRAMQFLDGELNSTENLEQHVEEMKSYKTVAVGGTFDRIHNGHRLLMSTSCLLANSKIIVGVSDKPLLVNKTLGELIEPLDVRRRNVEEFIDDIKPGLIKEIVPLTDPAGPTKTDPEIECLVVSAETLSGGHAVNKIRKEAGLPEMDLFSIELVGDLQSDSPTDELKLSSTGRRQEDLGVLLRKPKSKSNQSDVYVIGLTGGIASGKSSIAKRLEKLGAQIINADLVGHSVYEPGTEAYDEIIQHFGDSVLNSNGSINRTILGSIVFSSSDKLHLLNTIVWPKIMEKIKERISKIAAEGARVCVVEAALLLEAGWDAVVDEIWVSVIPEDEAVKRLGERNELSEEEAKKRLASQLKNRERVSRANVVLSTLWEPEHTQKQVEKAWRGLQERIQKQRVVSTL